MKSIHDGLRTETLNTAAGGGVEVTLARVVHGKDDATYGVHANPTSRSLSGGVQRDEFLEWVGFKPGPCTFVRGAYGTLCRMVPAEFDLSAFARTFEGAYAAITDADRHLQECGFFLESRDFPAKHWVDASGDGHTGSEQNRTKESEDEHFRFVLSWMMSGGRGGWTTHYKPKAQPLSPDMTAVFALLGLHPFESCVEFDFERCYWRRVRREEQRGSSLFDANNETVHKWYDEHARNFSPGVERLLTADAEMRKFDMGFLDLHPARREVGRGRPTTTGPRSVEVVGGTADVQNRPPQHVAEDETDDFEVAITFAGPERPHARALATILDDAGVPVFYDEFFDAQLWGKDLVAYFDRIYRKKARYCVMFISAAYRDGMWTTMERRSALARALDERGGEYILPVRVEHVDIEGLPPTIGYLTLDKYPIAEIAQLLLEKLGRA